MDKNKNYKLKRILTYISIILFSMALAVGGYYVYNEFFSNGMAPSVKELIDDKKNKDYPQDKEEEVENYVNLLPGYRNQYNNPNIMGRIEIPGLNIDTLITRASNNSYYLDYNLYNQYDQIGAPFFDYRNLDLSNNRQINIYGHNTQNTNIYDKLPFINLEAYTDRKIFDTNKNIYLSIDSKKIHYEVIAVKILTDANNNEHMKLIFYSDEDFLVHANKMLSDSLYVRDNLSIKAQDKLIVLQICHFNPANSFLLVIGKAVS